MRILTTLTIALLIAVIAPVAVAAKLKVPQHYASIDDAIDAAGWGDVIVISEGIYNEVVRIHTKNNLTVRGKGKVIIRPIGEGSAIYVTNCNSIRLTNLRVRNCTDSGVNVNDSNVIEVVKCDIRSTGTYGISVANSHQVLLEKNKVRKAGSHGIRVNAHSVVIRNNTISNLSNAYAIDVRGHQNLIEKNVIRDVSNNGIVVSAAGTIPMQTMIADNVIEAPFRGIFVNAGVEGVTIVGNRISKPNGSGIMTLDGSSLVILDNRVIKAAATGISFQAGESMISGNRLTGCHNGISLNGDDNSFLNNRMIKSQSIGFSVGASATGNVICGNVMKKSGTLDLAQYGPIGVNEFLDNTFETSGH